MVLKSFAPVTVPLPVTHGGMTLTLIDPGPLWSVAPARGRQEAVSRALKKATGVGLPGTGRIASSGDAGIQWFGRGQWLVSGAPMAEVADAAVTDQSDAWVVLDLAGPRIADVMARLVPVDLRADAFPEGAAIRTELHGMMVAIARTEAETIRIMGFRWMARTLSHAVAEAMESVASL